MDINPSPTELIIKKRKFHNQFRLVQILLYKESIRKNKMQTNKIRNICLFFYILLERDIDGNQKTKLYVKRDYYLTSMFLLWTLLTDEAIFSYLLLGHNCSPNCLRIIPFLRLRQRANGGCNRLAEGAHSYMALDHSSNFCRGSCFLCSCLAFFLFDF